MLSNGAMCPSCWLVWLGMNLSGEDCLAYNNGRARYASIGPMPVLYPAEVACSLCGKVSTLCRQMAVEEKDSGLCSDLSGVDGLYGSRRSHEGSKVNPMTHDQVKMGTFWVVLFEFREGPTMNWRQEEHTVFVGLDEQLMESDVDDEVFFTVESVDQFVRLDFEVILFDNNSSPSKAVPVSVLYQDRTLSL